MAARLSVQPSTVMALSVGVLGLVALVGVLLRWLYQTVKLRRQINKIPGPPTIPLLGNALQMTSGPGKSSIAISASNSH